MAKPLAPFIGIRSGLLVVISDLGTNGAPYKRKVLCQCDCGQTAKIELSNIRTKHTTSCGCVQKVWQKSGQTLHGLCRTAEHGIWSGMIGRCTNPNNAAYHNYGGRGIKVCERWLSFENFIYDMGMRPSKNHSLDRFPDNDGHYDPTNCRWATRAEQSLNKRTNRFYEYDGVVLTQSQWAKKLGVRRHMILNHIRRGKTFTETVKYLINNGLVKF